MRGVKIRLLHYRRRRVYGSLHEQPLCRSQVPVVACPPQRRVASVAAAGPQVLCAPPLSTPIQPRVCVRTGTPRKGTCCHRCRARARPRRLRLRIEVEVALPARYGHGGAGVVGVGGARNVVRHVRLNPDLEQPLMGLEGGRRGQVNKKPNKITKRQGKARQCIQNAIPSISEASCFLFLLLLSAHLRNM